MKLFELFEKQSSGLDNLKKIAEAVKNNTSAKLNLGESVITVNNNTANYIYDLYERARVSGNLDRFMSELSTLSGPIMENKETLEHVKSRFPKEVKDFEAMGALDEDLYYALFDYYHLHGEMPYNVAKGKEIDPRQWVAEKFDSDLNVAGTVDVPMEDMFGPNEEQNTIAELQAMGMFESKKSNKKMLEATDDDEDWWGWKEPKKTAQGGSITTTSKGSIHKGKYGTEYQGDSDEDEDDTPKSEKKPKIDREGKPAEKRSRGRPSAAVSKSDSGTSVNDYAAWYRKVKRSHAGAKVVGSKNKAVAVVSKGNKNYVAGEWTGENGSISSSLSKTISSNNLNSDYKSAKGRPKKVREFVENLRYVVEAKNHMGETEYNTYSGWRAACKRAGADEFEGDRDICQAKKGGKGVGEWDGASGSVYDDAHKKAKK